MAEDNQQIKKILDRALLKDLSAKERGEVYANFALLYLQTVNNLNRQYELILDNAIALLKSTK